MKKNGKEFAISFDDEGNSIGKVTDGINKKAGEYTEKVFEKTTKISGKVGKYIERVTENKNGEGSTLSRLFVKIQKLLYLAFQITIKHKKPLIISFLSIVGIFFLIGFVSNVFTAIYFNKIPQLYEEKLKTNEELQMLMYFDNSDIDIKTVNYTETDGKIFRGLYANGASNGHNYNDDPFATDPFAHNYGELNESYDFGGYVSYEVNDKYTIDELTIQKSYDKLLDEGIEVIHQNEGKNHIFYGGIIDDGKSIYKSEFFKGLNKYVGDNSFLAIGLKRNRDFYNTTINGKLNINGFDKLGLKVFSSRNIINYLTLNNILSRSLGVIDKELGSFDDVYYIFSNIEGNMKVEIIVEGKWLEPLESVSKSICSKLKTDYLENKEEKHYGFNGYNCQSKSKGHTFKVEITYNDIKNHLQKLSQ